MQGLLNQNNLNIFIRRNTEMRTACHKRQAKSQTRQRVHFLVLLSEKD